MHEAQHSFDVVLRGYDRSQVADTIERLEADFRIALADRDAAVSRSADLARPASALHGEIEALRRKAATASAPTFENISERIQHMLQLAEEEAGGDPPRRRAGRRRPSASRPPPRSARCSSGTPPVRPRSSGCSPRPARTPSRSRRRRRSAPTSWSAKAQERVARLDAESQARRAKVEEDFDIAQRARRAEAARLEDERERVSTQAARQRIAAAEQHAAQLVAEAEAKAEAIRDVRDELTGRLLQARQLLSALPDLGDRPQEQSAAPAQSPASARPPASPRPRPGSRTPSAADAPARRPRATPQTAPQPRSRPPRGGLAARRPAGPR